MDNRIRALEETQEYADEDPAEKELAAFEALAELPTTRDYHSSCGGLLWLSIRTRPDLCCNLCRSLQDVEETCKCPCMVISFVTVT